MVIIFIRAIKKRSGKGINKRKKRKKRNIDDAEKYDLRLMKWKKQKKELEEQKRLEEEKRHKGSDESEESEDEDEDFEEMEKKNGIEISGYIDYSHRLKMEDFTPYFKGEKLLYPKSSDLSYYNWNVGTCVSNDSHNFKVDASSGKQGLLFRNKKDRKVINVNPASRSTDNNTRRIVVKSLRKEYKQIVIFDHYTRRKT